MDSHSRFREALVIGALAPGYEYMSFSIDGILRGAWRGPMGGFFIVEALAGGIAFSVSFLAIWFLGYPLIRLVAHLLHWIFARRVPLDDWDNVVDRSVKLLPYAAALGVLTWLVYSIGSFGGWPGDVIFGTIGHLIGAVCYVPLVVGWFGLWRRARAATEWPADSSINRQITDYGQP